MSTFLLLLFSCKKEIENRAKNDDPKKNVARLIDGTEAEDILSDLEEFYTYTEEVATSPGSLPAVLPNAITPERANAMVENVFNYYFARLNQKLTNDVTVEISKTLAVDEDGNVSTLALAEAFNEMREDLRDFYEGQKNDNETAEFILADAEYQDAEGGIKITLYGIIAQDPFEPETSEMRAFGSDDKWSVRNKAGRYDGACNGLWGSPELISIAVNSDMTSNPKLLLVNIVNYKFRNDALSLSADPSNYGAPDNPMYLINSTVWKNKIMHLVYNYGIEPDEPWVIPAAMTYYRTWIPALIANDCTILNKYFVRLNILAEDLLTTSPHPTLHRMFDYYFGDRLKVLPTDPYMQVPNVAISL